MKTPHTILIGLSLIAAAIFIKHEIIQPAEAASEDVIISISCRAQPAVHYHQIGVKYGTAGIARQ